MPNFNQTAVNKFQLTDEAVRDFATVIAYFRLTHSTSAREHARIGEGMGDERSIRQAAYHKAFDAMLAELGSNLRINFDVFKLSIARTFVDNAMLHVKGRRAAQLTGGPGELLRVYELTQGSGNPADDSRVCDAIDPPGTQPVDRDDHGGDRREGIPARQRTKRKRP